MSAHPQKRTEFPVLYLRWLTIALNISHVTGKLKTYRPFFLRYYQQGDKAVLINFHANRHVKKITTIMHAFFIFLLHDVQTELCFLHQRQAFLRVNEDRVTTQPIFRQHQTFLLVMTLRPVQQGIRCPISANLASDTPKFSKGCLSIPYAIFTEGNDDQTSSTQTFRRSTSILRHLTLYCADKSIWQAHFHQRKLHFK